MSVFLVLLCVFGSPACAFAFMWWLADRREEAQMKRADDRRNLIAQLRAITEAKPLGVHYHNLYTTVFWYGSHTVTHTKKGWYDCFTLEGVCMSASFELSLHNGQPSNWNLDTQESWDIRHVEDAFRKWGSTESPLRLVA